MYCRGECRKFVDDYGALILDYLGNSSVQLWERGFSSSLQGSRKKVLSLVVRPLRPLRPPLELNGNPFFSIFFRKKSFFLSGTTSKKGLFCVFPYLYANHKSIIHFLFALMESQQSQIELCSKRNIPREDNNNSQSPTCSRYTNIKILRLQKAFDVSINYNGRWTSYDDLHDEQCLQDVTKVCSHSGPHVTYILSKYSVMTIQSQRQWSPNVFIPQPGGKTWN